MNNNNNSLQKTIKFRNTQDSIIKTLSKQCNQKTYINTLNSNGTDIKHFKLSNGTHVYSVNGNNSIAPARLFSPIELPNITYFANHWNPILLPNNDIEKINGTFISVNSNSVSYNSYIDGDLLFRVGYNFDLNNIKKTSYFCIFDKSNLGHTFSEIPNGVTSILDLLTNRYKRLKNAYQNIPREKKVNYISFGNIIQLFNQHYNNSFNILSTIQKNEKNINTTLEHTRK